MSPETKRLVSWKISRIGIDHLDEPDGLLPDYEVFVRIGGHGHQQRASTAKVYKSVRYPLSAIRESHAGEQPPLIP